MLDRWDHGSAARPRHERQWGSTADLGIVARGQKMNADVESDCRGGRAVIRCHFYFPPSSLCLIQVDPKMVNDEAFIQAILAEPNDDTARLVYADWLEEHDNPCASDYLRTELKLAKLPLDSPEAP